ncbi:MAG: aminotransferase class V-fold PLP-dependent enzyme, partial [Clostridia bacterium]|nr:aminotransferase class V-fold PLP-dependent enzyme [Clostridia bacterium]
MAKKATDFRYNTGETKVPWAAVGENYNVHDLMEIIRFLMQGEGKEYDEAIASVWEQVKKLGEISTPPGKLSLASKVEEAENACNEYLGINTSTFVTNATAGFEIAYKYANLKPGDEVIVPAITFVATMAYPLAVGAKLVFADVDPKTINMDPKDVEKKITDKTKMIVPVHIGGYPVDLDPIMELAKKHDIIVLEDAAHAFGAMYNGRKVGTIGDFAAFSMHEVKNITSFGEGGIVTTNVPNFGDEMKRARFLGLDFTAPIKNWLYNITPIPGKYEPFVASNYSTTEIQGLGLTLQIARNEEIIAQRRRAAELLNNRLSGNDAIININSFDKEIKMKDVSAIKINITAPKGQILSLFHVTTEDGVFNEEKRINKNHTVSGNHDIIIYAHEMKKMEGVLTGLRIDPVNSAGNDFIISTVEFLKAPKTTGLIIDGYEFDCYLTPMKNASGAWELPFDPGIGLEFALNSFHRWDKENKVLELDFKGHSYVFTAGSSKYIFDGTEKDMGF